MRKFKKSVGGPGRAGVLTAAVALGLLPLVPASAAYADATAPAPTVSTTTADAPATTTADAPVSTTSTPPETSSTSSSSSSSSSSSPSSESSSTSSTSSSSSSSSTTTTPPPTTSTTTTTTSEPPTSTTTSSGSTTTPSSSTTTPSTSTTTPPTSTTTGAVGASGTELGVGITSSAFVDTNRNGRVDAGESYKVVWKVTNTSGQRATGLAIANGAGSTTCAATTLAAHASTACTTLRNVPQADVDAGTISASARASAVIGGFPTATGWAQAPKAVTAYPGLTVTQKYNITRDTDGDGRVSVGDSIGFVYDLSNSGNVTLDGPAVTSRLLRDRGLNVTCRSSTLYTQADRAGQWIRCWSPGFVVNRSQLTNGKIVNNAVISARTKVGDRLVSAVSTLVISPIADRGTSTRPPKPPKTPAPKPGIFLVSRVSHVSDEFDMNGFTDVGDKITLQFVVTNSGMLDLSRVTVSDKLLAKQSIAMSCPASSLAPGQTMVCTGQAPYTVTRQDFASGNLSTVSVAQAIVDVSGKTIGSRAKLVRPLAVKLDQTLGASVLAYTGTNGMMTLTTTSGVLLLLGCGFVAAGRRRTEPVMARHRSRNRSRRH